MVSHIPANSHVLIIGGGSGKILEEIANIHPEGIKITYVEISSGMLEKAKKRNIKYNTVAYVLQAIEDYQSQEKYDVIITPFLFDNFKQEKVNTVFHQLNGYLKEEGLWLQADFVNTTKTWQKLVLKTMYVFFKFMTNIEADNLIDITYLFKPAYHKIAESTYCSGFIKASVYKKWVIIASSPELVEGRTAP